MKERGRMEQLWSHEKYRVMFHSQKHYNEIREVLKGAASYETVEELIMEAIKVSPTKGSMMNAIDHMWGYFRNCSDEDEKAEYRRLKEHLLEGEVEAEALLYFLAALSKKYDERYLLNSSILESYI